MNELRIFKNEEFGTIRTFVIDGKSWFVGNDVARALEYSRPRDAIANHCRGGRWIMASKQMGEYRK